MRWLAWPLKTFSRKSRHPMEASLRTPVGERRIFMSLFIMQQFANYGVLLSGAARDVAG